MVSSNEQSLRSRDKETWHKEEGGKGSLLKGNLDK